MTTTATTGEDGTESAAPSVVAVVVTCNPGPWFEEALAALRDQDYPNLAVLVVDTASIEDPLPRIAAALPHAYVRRLSRNPGYAAATNRALRIVQGASHFVLCHDDVAPAPDAIRKMLEEAYRQNAGIVAPKLVSWDDPNVLVSMGGTADPTGALIPAIEPGEVDQGQHDTVTDIFIATGGCMLVRSDLFETLGGFDAAMTMFGEDVDFSWRAQLAGARIVSAPSARVRHLEAAANGLRVALPMTDVDDGDSEGMTSPVIDEVVLRRRHRLRTALKVRRRTGFLLTVIQLLALTTVETVYALITNRSGHASALIAAWAWNATHWRDLLRARLRLRQIRTVKDKAINARLGSSKSRLEASVRKEWEFRRQRLHREGWAGRDVVGVVRNLTVAVWATVAIIWLVGSREILGSDPLPSVGQFMPWPASFGDSLRHFFGILPAQGFGTDDFTSPVHLVAAALGVITFNTPDIALKIMALATLPVGMYGMVRLARPLGSTRGRLAAIVAYAAVPVPYDAIGLGRLDVLIAYAAAPWILHRLLRAHATSPYISRRVSDRLRLRFNKRKRREDEELESLDVSMESATHGSDASAMLDARRDAPETVAVLDADTGRDLVAFVILRRIVPLALLLVTAGAFAPQLIPATFFAGVLIVLGSYVGGRPQGETAERVLLLVTVASASVVAITFLLPALLDSAHGIRSLFETVMPARERSFAELLRLESGLKSSAFTAGLIVAGLPALLTGSQWRMQLSIKLWFVVVGLVTIVWIGAQGWLDPIAFEAGPFLAIAGAAAALNAAVSVHSLTEDLRRYNFGWRHLLPIVTFAGIAFALVPIAERAGNGAWDLPKLTTPDLLSWVDDKSSDGSFRVLWLGDQDVMPGGPRPITTDLAASIGEDAAVPQGPAAPVSGGEAQIAIGNAITTARQGNTVSLGHMIAPYDVRYIAIPNATGVLYGPHIDAPPPPDLLTAMRSQLDLIEVGTDSSVTVFENTTWLPVRSALTPDATLAARSISKDETYASTDFRAIEQVLERGHGNSWHGDVPGGEIYAGVAWSEGWHMSVNDKQAAKQKAFNWAQTFSTDGGGGGHLYYRPPVTTPMVQAFVALGWVSLAFLAFKFRARRGRYM